MHHIDTRLYASTWVEIIDPRKMRYGGKVQTKVKLAEFFLHGQHVIG